ENHRTQNRGDLSHTFREAEPRGPILGREQFACVWVHSSPGPEVEETHKCKAHEERAELRRGGEDVAAHAAENEEEGQGPFATPFLHEVHGDSIPWKLRERRDDEERREKADIGSDSAEHGKREWEGQKETVVTEVQRDPHDDGHG